MNLPIHVYKKLLADLDEANKAHAIAYGALTIALLENGVLTTEQYDRAFAQATHEVDEEFARKRDKGANQ